MVYGYSYNPLERVITEPESADIRQEYQAGHTVLSSLGLFSFSDTNVIERRGSRYG